MNHPIAIIQARMGSSRLPGKVLRPILGKPMLWHIVERVRFVRGLQGIVVATTDSPQDEPIRAFCREEGIVVFSGSENDVLDRFYQAAAAYDGDPLIRITADCPLIDPELLGRLLQIYRAGCYDHVSIATGAGALFLDGGKYPDGLDAECFSFSALETAWRKATESSEREHVTPYIWRVPGRSRLYLVKSEVDCSEMRWTVDHEEDLLLVQQIYEELYCEERPFLFKDVLAFLSGNPALASLNHGFIGREGYARIWQPQPL